MPRPPLPPALPRLTTHLASHHFDLLPLMQAVQAHDWPTVERFFAELPQQHDPAYAVRLVSGTSGVERFLAGVGDSPLAGTLLAARLVVLGWQKRTAQQAKDVTQSQFRAFHEHLVRADDLLERVTAEQPDNSAAWTEQVRVARGLELGQREAWRRYEGAAQARSHPYGAQGQMLQQLAPKWGGSVTEMHAFARECAEQAPPGALNAALIAEAYYEHLVAEGRGILRQAVYADQLTWAVARSAGHPDFQPVHGWTEAVGHLALSSSLAGRHHQAMAMFDLLGNRAAASVWDDPMQYVAIRNRSRLRSAFRAKPPVAPAGPTAPVVPAEQMPARRPTLMDAVRRSRKRKFELAGMAAFTALGSWYVAHATNAWTPADGDLVAFALIALIFVLTGTGLRAFFILVLRLRRGYWT